MSERTLKSSANSRPYSAISELQQAANSRPCGCDGASSSSSSLEVRLSNVAKALSLALMKAGSSVDEFYPNVPIVLDQLPRNVDVLDAQTSLRMAYRMYSKV